MITNKENPTEEKAPETEQVKTTERPKRSVAVYLTILFAVAFLLLLLAFFMQQRSNETIIGNLQNSASTTELLNQLIDENRNLQKENDALSDQLEALGQELNGQQALYDDLKAEEESLLQQNEVLTGNSEYYEALSGAISALYDAQLLILDEDYTAAALKLTAANTDGLQLLELIRIYDSSLSSPDAMPLEPRYNDLVSTLCQQGVLTQDENGALSIVGGVLEITP